MNSSRKKITSFKLIELLETFSSLEMKRFSRFLQSPYFNNSKVIVDLYEVLRPFHPRFENAKFNRARIWKKLFKQAPFNPHKFKKLFFDLNALAESFLSVESLRNNKRTCSKLLIQSLKDRHFKRFEKESLALAKSILEIGDYKTQQDFLDIHLLYQDVWFHLEKDKHHLGESELEASYLNFKIYQTFEQIKTAGEYQTRSKFLKVKTPESSLNIDLDLDLTLIKQHPSLTSAYSFYQFSKTPNWLDYEALKGQLIAKNEQLNIDTIQDGVMHLNNFLAAEIAGGKYDLRSELFNLLKWAAAENVFIKDGKIYEMIFLNTVVIAASQKEITWAKTYIQQNSIYVQSVNSQLVLNYCKAVLYFLEGKFDLVLSELVLLQPGNKIQFYFSIKTMLIRSFYELMIEGRFDYFEPITNELNAFEKGVRRNKKFSTNRIQSYLNFIKLMRKLVNYTLILDLNATKFHLLKNEILTTQPLMVSHWFVAKIAFFEKKLQPNS